MIKIEMFQSSFLKKYLVKNSYVWCHGIRNWQPLLVWGQVLPRPTHYVLNQKMQEKIEFLRNGPFWTLILISDWLYPHQQFVSSLVIMFIQEICMWHAYPLRTNAYEKYSLRLDTLYFWASPLFSKKSMYLLDRIQPIQNYIIIAVVLN